MLLRLSLFMEGVCGLPRTVERVCGLPHSAQHFGLQNGLSDTEMVQIFRCAGPNREALFIAKRGARRKIVDVCPFSRGLRSLFAPPGSLRSETVAGASIKTVIMGIIPKCLNPAGLRL